MPKELDFKRKGRQVLVKIVQLGLFFDAQRSSVFCIEDHIDSRKLQILIIDPLYGIKGISVWKMIIEVLIQETRQF